MFRLLALMVLATPALAQSASSRVCFIFCDPADPRTTKNGMAACDLDVTHAVAPQPARDAVVRLYAALGRSDQDAVTRALDDHAMWVAPGERAVGAAAVARRLMTLWMPETLHADASDRIVATAHRPDGQAVQAAWTLIDGLVIGVEQTPD